MKSIKVGTACLPAHDSQGDLLLFRLYWIKSSLFQCTFAILNGCHQNILNFKNVSIFRQYLKSNNVSITTECCQVRSWESKKNWDVFAGRTHVLEYLNSCITELAEVIPKLIFFGFGIGRSWLYSTSSYKNTLC